MSSSSQDDGNATVVISGKREILELSHVLWLIVIPHSKWNPDDPNDCRSLVALSDVFFPLLYVVIEFISRGKFRRGNKNIATKSVMIFAAEIDAFRFVVAAQRFCSKFCWDWSRGNIQAAVELAVAGRRKDVKPSAKEILFANLWSSSRCVFDNSSQPRQNTARLCDACYIDGIEVARYLARMLSNATRLGCKSRRDVLATFVKRCKCGDIAGAATIAEIFSLKTLMGVHAFTATCTNAFLGACGTGELETVKWLVDEFAMTSAMIRNDDDAAFKLAAGAGHVEILKWIEEKFKLRDSKHFRQNRVISILLHTLIEGDAETMARRHTDARWIIDTYKIPKCEYDVEMLKVAMVNGNVAEAKELADKLDILQTDPRVGKIAQSVLENCGAHADPAAALEWFLGRFTISDIQETTEKAFGYCLLKRLESAVVISRACNISPVQCRKLCASNGLFGWMYGGDPNELLNADKIVATFGVTKEDMLAFPFKSWRIRFGSSETCKVFDWVAARFGLERRDACDADHKILEVAFATGRSTGLKWVMNKFGITYEEVRPRAIDMLVAYFQNNWWSNTIDEDMDWFAGQFKLTLADIRANDDLLFRTCCQITHLKEFEWFIKRYARTTPTVVDAWKSIVISCLNEQQLSEVFEKVLQS